MVERARDSKPISGTKRSPASRSARTIAIGYGVVAFFLAIFLLTVAVGTRNHNPVGEPRWAFLLALLAILPIFLPMLMTYVVPRITMVKISNIMEMSFAKAEITSYSLADLTVHLPEVAGEANAADYITMMTISYSSYIVDMIRTARMNRDAVIVVDLGDGNKWIPPNLFILARLARDYTVVRLIGFVETRNTPGAFVGMSSPSELMDGLRAKFPAFIQASSLQEVDPAPATVATNFFSSLTTIYQQSPEIKAVKDMWLSGPVLRRLMATSMYSDQVESADPLPADTCRRILESEHSYVAAVKDEKLQFFIERDRHALLVARQMTNTE
jgi:hypothetical protein